MRVAHVVAFNTARASLQDSLWGSLDQANVIEDGKWRDNHHRSVSDLQGQRILFNPTISRHNSAACGMFNSPAIALTLALAFNLRKITYEPIYRQKNEAAHVNQSSKSRGYC